MYDYQFKAFNKMTDEDYKIIGFKSGLEVHQQLLTEKKLFCRCPAGKYGSDYNAEILRHMRPTLSELGEYDGTALMEFKTKKEIIYRIQYDTVCTYEMDDTPPFKMNNQALDIALELSMLLNANIVDEIHIARKQYLDGSIPTGFQRTAIVSVGGKIPYKDREINIIQMSIEEDSCREVSDIGHRRIYQTDRLGMPLVETVTAPEMFNPYEVADVNQILRKLARTTGKVRTGIGAAREDVNVSVTGGTRIEIKGVPRIIYIPLLTYNEAMRQWNLLRLREELKSRGVTTETFQAKFEDVTKIVRKTRYQPISDAIDNHHIINCVTVRNFRGLLRWQTQTDTYFSKEISDRVRVIACLTRLPNIIHSDSPSETLLSSEWQQVKKLVGATDDDTIVLVWGSKIDADLAASEIIMRCKEATIGIPSETRQALSDGTNGFERILPGPDRMYPDTDLPPIRITPERIQVIRKGLPVQFWHYENWYKQFDLPEYIIKELSISKYAKSYETIVSDWGINPKLAAFSLIEYPKRLARRNLDTSLLTPEAMLSIFALVRDKLIPKDGIIPMMEKIIEKGKFSKSIVPKQCTIEKIVNEIESAKNKVNKLKLNRPENAIKLIMKYTMISLRGKVNGKDVCEYLKKSYQGVE